MSPQPRVTVRRSSVAGSFYSAEPERLRHDVDGFVARASHPRSLSGQLRTLVAPHAGYAYSGTIAGAAYALLADVSPPPRRVAVLGPSHYVDLEEMALPEAGTFETPLGNVQVDALVAELSRRFPQVVVSAAAHTREHAIEVQLPFLQQVLPAGFTILPLTVGHTSPAEVADVIEFVWNQPDTLVVVSTDLSHYLPQARAREVDGATARHIVAGAFEHIRSEDACGCRPLAGLLLAAQRRGFTTELLDRGTSGDTAGDHERVVGYGAFAVYQPVSCPETIEP